MKKEEKVERFRRLAASRTNDVLKRLQVLSNCANRSAYEYSEEEVAKIFSAVEKAVKECRSKFYYPESKNKKFKL